MTTLYTFLCAFCQVIWHPRNVKEIPMTCFDIYCQMLLWEILLIYNPSAVTGNSHFYFFSRQDNKLYLMFNHISCLDNWGCGLFPLHFSYSFLFSKKDVFLFSWICICSVCACRSMFILGGSLRVEVTGKWEPPDTVLGLYFWGSALNHWSTSLAPCICLFYFLELVRSFPPFQPSICYALKLFD